MSPLKNLPVAEVCRGVCTPVYDPILRRTHAERRGHERQGAATTHGQSATHT
jgi:hypothetical protein